VIAPASFPPKKPHFPSPFSSSSSSSSSTTALVGGETLRGALVKSGLLRYLGSLSFSGSTRGNLCSDDGYFAVRALLLLLVVLVLLTLRYRLRGGKGRLTCEWSGHLSTIFSVGVALSSPPPSPFLVVMKFLSRTLYTADDDDDDPDSLLSSPLWGEGAANC